MHCKSDKLDIRYGLPDVPAPTNAAGYPEQSGAAACVKTIGTADSNTKKTAPKIVLERTQNRHVLKTEPKIPDSRRFILFMTDAIRLLNLNAQTDTRQSRNRIFRPSRFPGHGNRLASTADTRFSSVPRAFQNNHPVEQDFFRHRILRRHRKVLSVVFPSDRDGHRHIRRNEDA